MDKCTYNKLVEDCNSWIERKNNYLEERIKIIKEYKDNEDEQERQVKLVEEKYNAKDWNFYFGPWVEILDKSDLLDRNFILPGHDCCFLDLPNRNSQEILNAFGKEIVDCCGKYKGVVVGYGYDMTDDYLITEIKENNEVKKHTVMICEKYQIL